MPLTNYSLDKFVAQEMSSLTTPEATPVGAEFADTDAWLSSIVMRQIFTQEISTKGARLAFAWVRRTIAAIESYDEGCEALKALARHSPQHESKRIPLYFRALEKFEHAIAMLYQATDFARKAVNEDAFKSGDGSPLDRLNKLYNAGRHKKLTDLPVDHLHPVWLRNDGVYSSAASLTYAEIEGLLGDTAAIAAQISRGRPA